MARHLQVYTHEALTVTFEPARCIHAARCVRGLPAVFDATARPWIRPDAADAATILAVVQRCPTGALKATLNGVPQELERTDVTIEVERHGPLVVTGPVRVVDDATGAVAAEERRVALCRCGASRRKPFCDGSHRAAGFRDPA
jgi:uncharacterized Fe-S cluster protein YjdI